MLKEDAKESGGLKAVLAALRFAVEDEDIAAFLEKYDSIPSGDRERLPWEAIAIAADLNVKHFLGAIHIAVQQYSVSRVKFTALLGHPKITAARVKYGQMAGGEKDRAALDTAMGFLPSPKGPTFIGKAIFGSSSQSSSSGGDVEDGEEVTMFDADSDLDELFPPSNKMQEKLVPIRQKLLE